MSNTFRPQDGLGILVEIPNLGITEAYAPSAAFASVPSDGSAGFAEGCVFYNYSGPAGSEFYINIGSVTSSKFRPDETSGAGGSLLSAAMGSFLAEGNLYATAGASIAGNAADATDDILAGIQLPASIFDKAGRSLMVLAGGLTGATNNNKRAKIIIANTSAITYGSAPTYTAGVISGGVYTSGGNVIADTGAWVNATTPNNAVGWQLEANVIKFGAAAANTQESQGAAILGATHGGVNTPSDLTMTESATIDLIVTGSSYTSSAANDVKLKLFRVNWMN